MVVPIVAAEDDIGLVRALGFVAWADERIAPEEREMLTTVMDALGIPPERRAELCEAIRRAPPSLEEISASFTDDTERRFAVAQAILMAQADGELAPSERRDISRLAHALGIDDEELTQLYAAVDVTSALVPG
jgi:tellurite resistance protein